MADPVWSEAQAKVWRDYLKDHGYPLHEEQGEQFLWDQRRFWLKEAEGHDDAVFDLKASLHELETELNKAEAKQRSAKFAVNQLTEELLNRLAPPIPSAPTLDDDLDQEPEPLNVKGWDPEAPHSRACGIRKHDHGPDCHSNCPTCSGKDWRPRGSAI